MLSAVLAVLSGPAAAKFDFTKVDPSVVRIYLVLKTSDNKIIPGGSGSGFVVADEYVVTNNHVAAGPDAGDLSKNGLQFIGLVVPDGSMDQLRPAQVVKLWPELDLALIRVQGLKRPAVPLSSVAPDVSPASGEPVHAVGFPGAADTGTEGTMILKATLTSGTVGRVVTGRNSGNEKARPVVQHNAAISGGNSGGPLFNECHEVVGVNTYGPWSNVTFVPGPDGKPIPKVSAVSGIYFSPHVSNVIEVLRTQNVNFIAAAERCIPAVPGLSPMMYVYIAVALLIALAALAMAMRRPRQQIVQVVESYSQYLRRGGKATPADNKQGGDAAPVRRVAGGGKSADGPGWVLTGRDAKGQAIRLSIDAAQLAHAKKGLVIGRQRSVSDLIVDDPSVSRRHARVEASGKGIAVVDLNSSNGTKVGGQALKPYGEPAALAPGDTVAVGDVKLTLSQS